MKTNTIDDAKKNEIRTEYARLKQLSKEDLRRIHNRYYRISNLILTDKNSLISDIMIAQYGASRVGQAFLSK